MQLAIKDKKVPWNHKWSVKQKPQPEKKTDEQAEHAFNPLGRLPAWH